MKFRTSFVSNSSSCSFILGFDKIPKNYKELKKAIFGGFVVWVDEYDEEHFTIAMAKHIFDHMKEATEEDLLCEFGEGYDLSEEQAAKNLAEARKTIFKDKKLAIVELDDCVPEAYALFEAQVPFRRISHH